MAAQLIREGIQLYGVVSPRSAAALSDHADFDHPPASRPSSMRCHESSLDSDILLVLDGARNIVVRTRNASAQSFLTDLIGAALATELIRPTTGQHLILH